MPHPGFHNEQQLVQHIEALRAERATYEARLAAAAREFDKKERERLEHLANLRIGDVDAAIAQAEEILADWLPTEHLADEEPKAPTRAGAELLSSTPELNVKQ